MIRLVGSCSLTLCVAAGSLAAPPPAGAVAGYGDVAEGVYFTESVQWSVENAITGIDGSCFFPDTPASRGETAMYLWNAQGRPEPDAEHSFVDVTVESQNEAIAWMLETGITKGTTRTTFSPDDTVTRAELAAFLWRLDGRPTAEGHSFTDVERDWQQGPVSWLSETGVTTGTSPTTFSPDKTLARKELITFLWRYEGEPEVTVDPATPGCEPGVFIAVAAGGTHACGLRGDRTVACWGNSTWGQTESPAGSFSAVTASSGHSCGLRIDGTVACWGDSTWGQSDAPAGRFSAVSAGSLHSCGLRIDRTVACWGNNGSGESDAPTGSFTAVTTGWGFSCGLRRDRAVACWGNDSWGQSDAPAGRFSAVSAGSGHSCALRIDRTLACWGNDSWGQSDAPAGRFSAVSAGSGHSCALRIDRTLACWGNDSWGQSDPPSPTFSAVSAGSVHSCALRTTGEIACWGNIETRDIEPDDTHWSDVVGVDVAAGTSRRATSNPTTLDR